MKLKNMLLVVKDIDKSKDFYHRILGLHILFEYHGRAVLSSNITLQSLETWKDMIGQDDNQIIFQNHACQLSFEVEDLDYLIELLDKYQVTMIYSSKNQSWGPKIIRFYDPDGHIIEVSETLRKVVRRFLNLGLSHEEISKRLNLPLDYIHKIDISKKGNV